MYFQTSKKKDPGVIWCKIRFLIGSKIKGQFMLNLIPMPQNEMKVFRNAKLLIVISIINYCLVEIHLIILLKFIKLDIPYNQVRIFHFFNVGLRDRLNMLILLKLFQYNNLKRIYSIFIYKIKNMLIWRCKKFLTKKKGILNKKVKQFTKFLIMIQIKKWVKKFQEILSFRLLNKWLKNILEIPQYIFKKKTQ